VWLPGRENTGGGAFKEPDAGVVHPLPPRSRLAGNRNSTPRSWVDVQTTSRLLRAFRAPRPHKSPRKNFAWSQYLCRLNTRSDGRFVNNRNQVPRGAICMGSVYYYGMNKRFNAQRDS